MNEDLIKLRLRRCTPHDRLELLRMERSKKITLLELEKIADEMRKPHSAMIIRITAHLTFFAAQVALDERK